MSAPEYCRGAKEEDKASSVSPLAAPSVSNSRISSRLGSWPWIILLQHRMSGKPSFLTIKVYRTVMDKGHNAGELSCRLWPDMDGPMENLVYARLKPDTYAAARQNKKRENQ